MRGARGAYRDDLACIHDAGFGHIARAAAGVLVAELSRAGIDNGTIVELGCGSAISSRILVDAGYEVCGYDISPEMLALARNRVPEARFAHGSWCDLAELPPCVAVTAIGEVLSYGFDPEAGPDRWPSLLATVHRSMCQSGVFLFDVAGPDRAPRGDSRSFVEGDGWAVLVDTNVNDKADTLVRRITSFRVVDGAYRRDVEKHCLHLSDPHEVARRLERSGFSVIATKAYGQLALPTGLTAFVARKS